MLEQFLKSILAFFNQVSPMNTYIQRVPIGATYPYYQVNKVDITQDLMNSFFVNNTVRVYIRIWGEDEITLDETAMTIQTALMDIRGAIPILNEDGTQSNRAMRLEDVESIQIPTDVNEIYCVELNFKFETFANVSIEEFDLITEVHVGGTASVEDENGTPQNTFEISVT